MARALGLRWTFADAARFLGAKDRRTYPGLRATVVERLPSGSIGVRYWATVVVAFHPDGTATLATGGHRTATTKARLNGFTAAQIHQGAGAWFILRDPQAWAKMEMAGKPFRPALRAASMPFLDGARIDAATGRALGA